MNLDQMPDLLAPIAAVLTALGTGWLAKRSAVQVAREGISERRLEVDAQAYTRAKELYEAGIAQLEAQIDRLQRQINDERGVTDGLRQQVNQLQSTIAELRRQLIAAGIDVARLHGPGDGGA